MSGLTRAELDAAVAGLTAEERREYAKLTDSERVAMVTLHAVFPGARLVPEDPPSEKPPL